MQEKGTDGGRRQSGEISEEFEETDMRKTGEGLDRDMFVSLAERKASKKGEKRLRSCQPLLSPPFFLAPYA